MQTEIEITEDQLAIDWTLTESDIQFINKATNQFQAHFREISAFCLAHSNLWDVLF